MLVTDKIIKDNYIIVIRRSSIYKTKQFIKGSTITSSVRKFSNIAFVINEENVAEDGTYIKLKNIVYREIFN